MNLSTIIAKIIERRKRQVMVLNELDSCLDALKTQIYQLNALSAESHLIPSFQDSVQYFSEQLAAYELKIVKVGNESRRLAQRFNKESINIGVAGKARQGKSTLLKAISGLTDNAIPTSDGMPCTGAKSRIFHHNSRQNALIEFYTEEEFFKDILCEQFNMLEIQRPPIDLSDFAQKMPEPEPTKFENDALYKKRFKWLEKVHHNITEIRKILNDQSTIEEPLERVPSYVTQRDEAAGNERIQYLAVKVANIYTSFPNHDVTGLGLVDLPGLEAAQAHDKKLVRSLEHEVDCVILVKFPPDTGAEWERDDYAVINLIQTQIGKSKLSDWLIPVLNLKKNAGNQKQVEMLENNPPEIPGLKILKAVCQDRNEVEQNVFRPILSHLQNNLERMDREAIVHLRKETATILESLNNHLHSMRPLVQIHLEELNERKNFKERFNMFDRSFKHKLDGMLTKVRDTAYRKEVSVQFESHVHAVCDQARDINAFVTERTLAEFFTTIGGWPGAIQKQMHLMRSAIAKKLMNLDTFLDCISENILKQIIDDAIPPEVIRLLETVIDDCSRSKDIVRGFMDKLNCEDTLYPNLKDALKYVLEFEFSYKTHFHYRVRQQMKILDPKDPVTNKGFMSDFIAEDSEKDFELSSEDVLNGLATKLKEVVHCVRQKISKEMLNDPGDAMFAFAEELRDRLAWADGVMDDWEDFLFLNRKAIWPDEFDNLASESYYRKRWREGIEKTYGIIKEIEKTLVKI